MRVMLNNGARCTGEDEDHDFMRIPKITSPEVDER